MSPRDHLGVALRALMGSRLRSLLTTLGVVIGVAAVIGVTAVGAGAQSDVSATLKRLGPNVLIVDGRQIRVNNVPVTSSKFTITERDLAALRALPFVEAVAPSRARDMTVSSARFNGSTTVTGITAGFGPILNYTVVQGRFISDLDVRIGRRVAVIGLTPLKVLFPNGNALGQTIQIGGADFQIVGVLNPKGVIGQNDYDDNLFVPLTAAEAVVFGDTHFATANIRIRDGVNLGFAQQQITNLLRTKHRLPDTYPDDFLISSQTDILATAQSATRTFTLLTGGIGAIALLVGGIGIMNIMLVAVSERTREIGLRKAIGAKPRTIQAQFLIEAILLSALGGLLGIGAGFATAGVIGAIAGWHTLVSGSSMVLGLGVASVIGLFFGFYPARRAARLDPISALRHE